MRTSDRSGLARREAGAGVWGGQAQQKGSPGGACLGSSVSARPDDCFARPADSAWLWPLVPLPEQPLVLDRQRLAQGGLVARQAGA